MSVSEYVPNQLLSRLVGHQLYSVQFTMGDRVEFWFGGAGLDEPHLLCDFWPIVQFEGIVYSRNDNGYGDALLNLIPAIVTTTAEGTGIGLEVHFAKGSLTLHPAVGEVDDEIATLTGFKDREWMVWRPGEDSFEDLA